MNNEQRVYKIIELYSLAALDYCNPLNEFNTDNKKCRYYRNIRDDMLEKLSSGENPDKILDRLELDVLCESTNY